MGGFTPQNAPDDLSHGFPPRPARFEPTQREIAILGEVIDALRLVGALLVLVGLSAALDYVGRGQWLSIRFGLITGVVTVPGVLYLIGAIGLKRRHSWAWGMSLTVTVLLMVTIVAVGVYAMFFGPARALSLACPALVYLAMPTSILIYMLRARPVIRDAELLVTKGFNVLPAARRVDPDGARPQPVILNSPAPPDSSPPPSPPQA